MNVSKGIYYYTTYTNHQITAVDMQKENLNGEMLVRYPMLQEEKILIFVSFHSSISNNVYRCILHYILF